MVEQQAPTRSRNAEEQGETFGRYRISGVLGHGGMGHLYVAEQRGIEGFAKVVALKRILPHLADTAQFQEMFLNEARVAARLDHPNIVATYELGEVDGKYFISMEYLPGEDLAAVLSRCRTSDPVPFDIAAMLLQQCAKGLHYAHEMRDVRGDSIGLVHRDVNPINIFVTYHGVVKILDFGVVGGESGYKSLPGVFKGKYAYCAPEQIEGARIDRRADIFSLGIVLWETLTGSRLFNCSTDALTIDAVRSLQIQPPSATRANVPPELDRIAMRALSRDPQLRFQTAQEMADALESYLTDRNDHRPSNGIGQWLESLFGSERALLKRAIAQGSSVEKNLARLKTLDGVKVPHGDLPRSSTQRPSVKPRVFWSTHATSNDTRRSGEDAITSGTKGGVEDAHRLLSTNSSGVAVPGPRLAFPATTAVDRPVGFAPTKMIMAFAAVALVALAVVVGLGIQKDAPSARSGDGPAVPPTASLNLASRPSGAHIFVDGDPTGVVTPTALAGLRAGRTVEVRLDLTGHQSARRLVELKGGSSHNVFVDLEVAVGLLRIEGLSRKAVVYLDDKVVDTKQPVGVSVGTHRLRVETATQDLLLTRTITIDPNGLVVRIPAGAGR